MHSITGRCVPRTRNTYLRPASAHVPRSGLARPNGRTRILFSTKLLSPFTSFRTPTTAQALSMTSVLLVPVLIQLIFLPCTGDIDRAPTYPTNGPARGIARLHPNPGVNQRGPLVPCTSSTCIVTVCHIVSPSLVPCRRSDVLLLSSLVSQHQSEFVDVLWPGRLNEPYLTARVSRLSNSHVLCDTPSAPLSLVGICISISIPSRCSRLSSRCGYLHLLTGRYRAF